VNSILAHNVIHDKGHRNVFHVIGEGFAKAVVHIDLPERRYIISRPIMINRLDRPFTFLEVYHRRRNKKSMAAGGCSDACHIKVWPA
jgi:hypothetical protein